MAYTMDAVTRYLQQVFTLEMARPEELAAHFLHCRYAFSMIGMNRKVYVSGLLEALCNKGIISDVDNLNENVADKLKQRRKRMTRTQRQFCDESELYAALTNAYQGLYLLTAACELRGAIPSLPYPEVLEQVYEARFSLFRRVPTPRYISF